MFLVSLVDPRLLPDPPDILFYGAKCHDHCDNIVIDPSLDLKVSSVIDKIYSVELSVIDVLDLLWCLSSP